MANLEQWQREFLERYPGLVIHLDEKGQANLSTDDIGLDLDSIYNEMLAIGFLLAHPKGTRKWRTHIANGKKSF